MNSLSTKWLPSVIFCSSIPCRNLKILSVRLIVLSETFIAKGKVILKAGWTAAAKDEDEETDSKDKDAAKESKQLPELHESDNLVLSVADYTEKNTAPPKPFTQTSLIGAMCNAHQYVKDASLKTKLKDVKGIGTEATRSKIIKELLDAEMLLETGKNLLRSFQFQIL